MAEIYAEANDITGAEAMYERALKKFKYSKKVWGAYQQFLLNHRRITEAKSLLSRSLQSLEKHKHIEIIKNFALGQFNNNLYDDARVLFEELLSSYPKRTDLWHVYIDKEISLGQFQEARNLLNRLTTSKLSSRNMKSALKKFLSFEVAHGNLQQQELVKQRAREYVSSLL